MTRPSRAGKKRRKRVRTFHLWQEHAPFPMKGLRWVGHEAMQCGGGDFAPIVVAKEVLPRARKGKR